MSEIDLHQPVIALVVSDMTGRIGLASAVAASRLATRGAGRHGPARPIAAARPTLA
jgi:hypothetical protein